VGNGEAYLLIDYRLVLGYNFYKNQWKNGTLPKLKGWYDYTWALHQHSCVFYQNKNYERYQSLELLTYRLGGKEALRPTPKWNTGGPRIS
jgi:hypothetical protein